MGFELKMSMKLSQQLRMTPQLQQAIKLLQLSRLELETALRKELDENPILEELQDNREEESTSEAEPQTATPEKEIVDTQDPRKQDEFDWESYIDSNQRSQAGATATGTDEIMNYENVISVSKTLPEHLRWQVGLSGFNEEEAKYALILIDYINDDGYLSMSLEEIAAEEEVDVQELAEILPYVQEFDPPGIGARNLKECLLIQARYLQEDTNDLVEMIEHHLPDLEKKNYDAIAKAMGHDVEDIIEMAKIILDMDPKPGSQFVVNDTHFVSPDVYVYKVGEKYVVSLNEEGLPKLRISNFYKNMLSGERVANETQEYIQGKLRSAVWLIKSIHQRQRTIYKVAESIVRHQYDFFEKGSTFIKPMILRDIADDIGMHESTVSRVTANKYMHTPRGIFELKYFFNSGITTDDGESLASESVKLKIKELLATENPKRPLSDQRIVDLLKKDGIQIARRTVAKYRDVLRILPSSKRKKYF